MPPLQVILCVSTVQEIIVHPELHGQPLVDEGERLQLKYHGQKLADHNNSTSLLLEEEKEGMREEIESLRTLQNAQLIPEHSARDTSGGVNGTRSMKDVAIDNGELTEQESVKDGLLNGKLNV